MVLRHGSSSLLSLLSLLSLSSLSLVYACVRTSFGDHSDGREAWVTVGQGTFVMGSPPDTPCPYDNQDRHQVTLTRGFEMLRTEVTQGQFQDLLGHNPAHFKDCGADCPVERVSWHDAAAYCNALSTELGDETCYQCQHDGTAWACKYKTQGAQIYGCRGYRLPTDAEWEWAYRAGTTTPLYSGPIAAALCNTCEEQDANAGAIGWYCANAGGSTHPVGQKRPNAWGLYDLAGNVWEWCHDGYEHALGSSAVTDPVGPATAPSQVARGGSFVNTANALYAAQRYSLGGGYVNDGVGFRCVRTTP